MAIQTIKQDPPKKRFRYYPTIFEARKEQIEFTGGQHEALAMVEEFLENSKDTFFLLAGYSGCGKTTIAENIANYTHAAVLAPTNAAVNRLREKINNNSLQYGTIHSVLFSPKDENGKFKKEKQFERRKVYIIDECSMIDKYILEVIIKDAVEKECKIIFMGDSFQLEPVGEDPYIFAWEKSYPEHFFAYNQYELTEVKRYDGSLLNIATQLRENKKAQFEIPEDTDLDFVLKFSVNMIKGFKEGASGVVLTSTNSRRVLYNHTIRKYKFEKDGVDTKIEKLLPSDVLVSVSNNDYFSNGELFNADSFTLIEEFKISMMKGAVLKEFDAQYYIVEKQIGFYRARIPVVLMPDLTESSFHGEQVLKSIKEGWSTVSERTKNRFIVEFYNRDNKLVRFFNKEVVIATYGYAISCHKAQGQEWDTVYIDAYWLMDSWDPARWFYTAITRAKNKVELVKNRYLKAY